MRGIALLLGEVLGPADPGEGCVLDPEAEAVSLSERAVYTAPLTEVAVPMARVWHGGRGLRRGAQQVVRPGRTAFVAARGGGIP